MANSIDQVAHNCYDQFVVVEAFNFIQEPKGEICKVGLFSALCQKVYELATYAFALIASGGGLFEARPEMPSLSLNRERYHLTAVIECHLDTIASAVSWNEEYIISNIAQNLLGLKDSLDLQTFDEQNEGSIQGLLTGDHREKAQLSFEVVALPSFLDNEQQVNFSALCKATVTVKSSRNREKTIDLMQAKLRAQDASIRLGAAEAFYQRELADKYTNYTISVESEENPDEVIFIAKLKEGCGQVGDLLESKTTVKASVIQSKGSNITFHDTEGTRSTQMMNTSH